MKKRSFTVILVIVMCILFLNPCSAQVKLETQDSDELRLQDMLMLFLLPQIDKKIDEIYAGKLTYSPEVYPYLVEVTSMHRVNGFRGFHFLITLEVNPTVGPHISVGRDRLLFDISPKNPDHAKLVEWKHLRDPQQSDFPPDWKDILLT